MSGRNEMLYTNKILAGKPKVFLGELGREGRPYF
jgi:hypothetical protein